MYYLQSPPSLPQGHACPCQSDNVGIMAPPYCLFPLLPLVAASVIKLLYSYWGEAQCGMIGQEENN